MIKLIHYSSYVLEAKLVTSNGMSISLLSEWVRNENGKEYDKQDCELTAFKRLAVRLKQLYPRLPVVVLADGLYANAPFFRICRENGWEFIVFFQDGNLPSVHQEINLLPGSAKQTRTRLLPCKEGFIREQFFEWINGIDYCGFSLSVIKCQETKTRIKSKKKSEETTFTHISSIPVDEKNYHQSMLLGHMINQFVEKSLEIVGLLSKDSKLTIIHLRKRLNGYFCEQEINTEEYDQFVRKRTQIRLA